MKIFESMTCMKWLRVIALIVTSCTAITLLTPSTSDNPIIQKAQNILNVLAGNVCHNINLDDPSVPPILQNITTDAGMKATLQEVEALFG